MQFGFETLVVWQKSRQLVKAVYSLVRRFPPEEKYGLSDQLRRAVISIPSNLAEVKGRVAIKEQIQFCHIAYGSLMEVTSHLILAVDLDFIRQDDLNEIRPLLEEFERLLRAYRNYLRDSPEK